MKCCLVGSGAVMLQWSGEGSGEQKGAVLMMKGRSATTDKQAHRKQHCTFNDKHFLQQSCSSSLHLSLSLSLSLSFKLFTSVAHHHTMSLTFALQTLIVSRALTPHFSHCHTDTHFFLSFALILSALLAVPPSLFIFTHFHSLQFIKIFLLVLYLSLHLLLSLFSAIRL